MNADEIRSEIERRKKKATDLKLREALWHLYEHHLRRYEDLLLKDLQMVYPELRHTMKISGTSIQFRTGTAAYELSYKEGRTEERERSGRSRDVEEEKIRHATLALAADTVPVFEFNIRRSTRYLFDGPVWEDFMGEITRFIDGVWVVELVERLHKIKQYEKGVWDERQSPALKQEMKHFGL